MPRPTKSRQEETKALHQQGLRHCPACDQTLPLSSFGAMKKDPYGLQRYCRPCVNRINREVYVPRQGEAARKHKSDYQREQRAQWRERTPLEEVQRIDRERNIWRLYKMTLEQFDSLLASQEGRCAICRTSEPTGRHGQWVVDHNHETDEIRGLLCDHCNRGLGFFRDSPSFTQAATDYLVRSRP